MRRVITFIMRVLFSKLFHFSCQPSQWTPAHRISWGKSDSPRTSFSLLAAAGEARGGASRFSPSPPTTLSCYTHTHTPPSPLPPHTHMYRFDMMMHCWAYNSGDRPHFATIHEKLDGLSHAKMVHYILSTVSYCVYVWSSTNI